MYIKMHIQQTNKQTFKARLMHLEGSNVHVEMHVHDSVFGTIWKRTKEWHRTEKKINNQLRELGKRNSKKRERTQWNRRNNIGKNYSHFQMLIKYAVFFLFTIYSRTCFSTHILRNRRERKEPRQKDEEKASNGNA